MYEKPTIIELGSVADFTRAGSPNQVDDDFFGLPSEGPRPAGTS
jgi:hypothetical protein